MLTQLDDQPPRGVTWRPRRLQARNRQQAAAPPANSVSGWKTQPSGFQYKHTWGCVGGGTAPAASGAAANTSRTAAAIQGRDGQPCRWICTRAGRLGPMWRGKGCAQARSLGPARRAAGPAAICWRVGSSRGSGPSSCTALQQSLCCGATPATKREPVRPSSRLLPPSTCGSVVVSISGTATATAAPGGPACLAPPSQRGRPGLPLKPAQQGGYSGQRQGIRQVAALHSAVSHAQLLASCPAPSSSHRGADCRSAAGHRPSGAAAQVELGPGPGLGRRVLPRHRTPGLQQLRQGAVPVLGS